MAEQISNGFPMLSEKNWWTIRDKFKASLPAAATPNYVKTLLTLSSDNSANSNVIAPMRRLGLLDDDNRPTALANDWRLDNKYKEACSVMVEQVYPRELLDLFPDSVVDRTTARNWFMGKGVGQGAADKMVALFILLKSGEIKEKKASSGSKTTVSVRDNKKSTKSKVQEKQDTPEEPKGKISQDTKSLIRPDLHIDLQIHISPESTPEQIDAIFASMAKHLYGADK